MFETSMIYIIFDEGTDLYWARSRVSGISELREVALCRQPLNRKLGPPATGVGWVYQYVLYPGYYCPDHPQASGHDEKNDRWYGDHERCAPGSSSVTKVRAFDNPATVR